jgi:hypothetical protein
MLGDGSRKTDANYWLRVSYSSGLETWAERVTSRKRRRYAGRRLIRSSRRSVSACGAHAAEQGVLGNIREGILMSSRQNALRDWTAWRVKERGNSEIALILGGTAVSSLILASTAARRASASSMTAASRAFHLENLADGITVSSQ